MARSKYPPEERERRNKAKAKEWREANRDRLRAYMATWRAENRERLREWSNWLLGHANDDPRVLRSAIRYLGAT